MADVKANEVTCKKCGATYERLEGSAQERDVEIFRCHVCGERLEYFAGEAIVSYRLVRRSDRANRSPPDR